MAGAPTGCVLVSPHRQSVRWMVMVMMMVIFIFYLLNCESWVMFSSSSTLKTTLNGSSFILYLCGLLEKCRLIREM